MPSEPHPEDSSRSPPESENSGSTTHPWEGQSYDELRRLAAYYLQTESNTVSLTPTVLVHEAYLRLSQQTQTQFVSRSHFLAVAATMMRRILVDHARSKSRAKRGGQWVRIGYDEELAVSPDSSHDVLDMEEALRELARLDDRQARIVEMRFFGGMTVPEVAEVLRLSTRTIENEWRLSRAWLRRRFETSNPTGSPGGLE